ncbi:MAG: glycerol kinase GlpK [Limnochordaceae bacterium]|nr:glycerol kinase GlpK [Limnochordaceae bacterium]
MDLPASASNRLSVPAQYVKSSVRSNRGNPPSYILALDQGTSSSRAIVFELSTIASGHPAQLFIRPVAVSQQPLHQHYPQPGWVEHDPEEIWTTQVSTAREAVARAGVEPDRIAAIGITNQRETTVVWERETGRPVHRAIVWQDRRTADWCRAWQASHPDKGEWVRQRTGLVLDPYFAGSKLRWLLDHVDRLRQEAAQGRLCFGTVDSWLLFRLTGGRVHATDPSNASRTLLFNIHSLQWDDDLMEALGIGGSTVVSMLPQVLPSAGSFGCTDSALFGCSLPITGMIGDQQAAFFGQGCLQPGMAKSTYGTGCFVLMNTGGRPMLRPAGGSSNGLLATVGWQLGNEPAVYALEGSVFIGGAAVQWLRDGLGIIRRSQDVEALARTVKDNGGVYFVPALTGLGTPYWDPYARGTIIGITRGTTAGHLARATLEAIAFQVGDVLSAMEREAALEVPELRVDGGAAVDDLLLQFQADILGRPVLRSQIAETTAVGAALLAGVGAGLCQPEDAFWSWQLDRRFEPAISVAQRERLYAEWHRAVARAQQWAVEGESG